MKSFLFSNSDNPQVFQSEKTHPLNL